MVYEGALVLEFEDRLLRHLEHVMVTRLRRNEPFAFKWEQKPSGGEESHGTVWVSTATSLQFRYAGPRRVEKLNRHWIEALIQSTYQPVGLVAVPEPAEPPAAPRRRE
jgi:hypothetical protein